MEGEMYCEGCGHSGDAKWLEEHDHGQNPFEDEPNHDRAEPNEAMRSHESGAETGRTLALEDRAHLQKDKRP